MARPDPTEYSSFSAGYVALVPEDDILPTMKRSTEETFAFLRSISEADSLLRHPPYTWSARQVVGHMADAERVFGYRALRISRGDKTPLAGFDENAFAEAGDFDRIAFADLVAEFESARRSHLYLFAGLPDKAWYYLGTANETPVSVRALAYIIVGHERHHMAILRRRFAKT